MTDSGPRPAEQLFEQLAVRLLADPAWAGDRVQLDARGWGPGQDLRHAAGTDLVLKLPKDQVDRLVESGVGAHFAPRCALAG